eukprot:5079-Heterococcus_DN1.PRE.2
MERPYQPEAGLRALERLKGAELLTPVYMMLIPAGFYAVLHCTGTTSDQARSAGWLFPIPPATDPLDMWRLFDFTASTVTASVVPLVLMAPLASSAERSLLMLYL